MSSTKEERHEERKEPKKVAPEEGKKEKPMDDYKSREFWLIRGTGTPAEEREEERAN